MVETIFGDIPTPSDVAIKKGRGEKLNYLSATGSGVLVDNKGKILDRASGGCHAFLTSFPTGGTVLVSGFQKSFTTFEKDYKEKVEIFCDYLYHRSVFKDVFLDKPSKKDGYFGEHFLINANMPWNVVSSCCCATRAIWEKQNQINMFCHLLSLDVDEDIAYILSVTCGNTRIKDGLTLSPFNGHTWFCAWDETSLKNIYNRKPQVIHSPFSKATNIHGMDALFAGRRTKDYMNTSTIYINLFEGFSSKENTEDYNIWRETYSKYNRGSKTFKKIIPWNEIKEFEKFLKERWSE